MRRIAFALSTVAITGLAMTYAIVAQPPRGGQGGRGPGERGGPAAGPPPNPLVDAIDTDDDHQISAQELANATTALKKLDRDRDGSGITTMSQ